MLRNVLGAYLDSVTERQLDLPLMALLAAMGFSDIHYTHGHVEFGKDFIAKRIEHGETIQYSFQSKAGDIGQAEWRNNIQGQILESVLTPLSHPNFATEMPHQAVLLTTGDLRGNAGIAMQSLNEQIERAYQRRSICFWGRENLIDLFEQYSATSVHPLSATGLASYAQFFLTYGKALRCELSDRELEEYTRSWLDSSLPRGQRLFRAAIEAAAISQQCASHGYHFEAIITQLCLLRVVLDAAYTDGVDSQLHELYIRALSDLHVACLAYSDEVARRWYEQSNLIIASAGTLAMTTYLVQCSRIVEVATLAYFTTKSEPIQQRLGAFIESFIRQEPGCSHPLGDRYAISTVLAVLLLCDRRQPDIAQEFISQTAIWLCDRTEQGVGIARFEMDENEETQILLGHMFTFIDCSHSGGSMLAATLCDLAAFLGDRQLYSDIINDMLACHIFPEYWQPADTAGVCRIESEDVVSYPNVRYTEELTTFTDYSFADYLPHESSTFRIADAFGPTSLMILMVLLRDRYFPKLWPRMVPGWLADMN